MQNSQLSMPTKTLLVRAEAKAMLGRYDAAVADLNTLLKVFIRSEAKSTEATRTLTLSGIQSFYNALRYYTPSQPTVKKQLHTDFTIEATNARTSLAAASSTSVVDHHPRRSPHARREALWHDYYSPPREC